MYRNLMNVNYLILFCSLVSAVSIPSSAANASDTIAPMVCTGISEVSRHKDYVYNFSYNGNLGATITETRFDKTTILGDNLHCKILFRAPPPGGHHGNPVMPITGLTCHTWDSEGPSTGFQINFDIGDNADISTFNGTLRFCIDDNCPAVNLLPNGYITSFSCSVAQASGQ
jgi:hypothetical protein